MKALLVISMLLMLTVAGSAQVSVPTKDERSQFSQDVYGLGVSASVVSGFGLSFRHHLPSDMSYQLVAGVIKSGGNVIYNFGGEGQLDIARGEKTRFYACAGLGYFHSGSSGSNDLDGPFRVGAGIGGEWRNLDLVHISGGLLFTYFSDGTILPLPEVSVHYYFY